MSDASVAVLDWQRSAGFAFQLARCSSTHCSVSAPYGPISLRYRSGLFTFSWHICKDVTMGPPQAVVTCFRSFLWQYETAQGWQKRLRGVSLHERKRSRILKTTVLCLHSTDLSGSTSPPPFTPRGAAWTVKVTMSHSKNVALRDRCCSH